MIPCDRIEKITVCPFLRLKSLWNGNSEIAHSLILADVAQLRICYHTAAYDNDIRHIVILLFIYTFRNYQGICD
jgi:hypothetical protein